MGLCKCPKKKVTNLFCFQHRVNVCEHCLVSNHLKCIVQSYLRWLQDSDYNPVCLLCNHNLDNDQECVRLLCYDVFHWECLDAFAKKLPKNTAPAGYQCPICKAGLFPASNQVSPVPTALRSVLSRVNWARVGLGLPLIEDDDDPEENDFVHVDESTLSSQTFENGFDPPALEYKPEFPEEPPALEYDDSLSVNSSNKIQISNNDQPPHYHSAKDQDNPQHDSHHSQSVGMKIDGRNLLGNPSNAGQTAVDMYSTNSNPSRKLFDTTGDDVFRNTVHDHDVDKYKRRPAFHWFAQWFKSRQGTLKKRDPNAAFKKFVVILTLGIIGFVTVVVIFDRLGRQQAEHDPFLDPMANPNIRIGKD